VPDALHEWVFVLAAVALAGIAVEWWSVARGWWTALLVALAVEQLGLALGARAGHLAGTGTVYDEWLGWMGAVLAFISLRVVLGRLVARRIAGGQSKNEDEAGDGSRGGVRDGESAVGTPAGRAG
jgi:hypothetical protein